MRRTKKEVKLDILNLLLHSGLSLFPTKLMEKANLNSKTSDIYLKELENSGLIRKNWVWLKGKKKHAVFTLTNKGIDYYITNLIKKETDKIF